MTRRPVVGLLALSLTLALAGCDALSESIQNQLDVGDLTIPDIPDPDAPPPPLSCDALTLDSDAPSPGDVVAMTGFADGRQLRDFSLTLDFGDDTVVPPVAVFVDDAGELRMIVPTHPSAWDSAHEATLSLRDETATCELAMTVEALPPAPEGTLDDLLAATVRLNDVQLGEMTRAEILDPPFEELDRHQKMLRLMLEMTEGSETASDSLAAFVAGDTDTLAGVEVDRELYARVVAHTDLVGAIEALEQPIAAANANLLAGSSTPGGLSLPCVPDLDGTLMAEDLSCLMKAQVFFEDAAAEASGNLQAIIGIATGIVPGNPVSTAIGITQAITALGTKALAGSLPSRFVHNWNPNGGVRIDRSPDDHDTFLFDDTEPARIIGMRVRAESEGWELSASELLGLALSALGAWEEVQGAADARRIDDFLADNPTLDAFDADVFTSDTFDTVEEAADMINAETVKQMREGFAAIVGGLSTTLAALGLDVETTAADGTTTTTKLGDIGGNVLELHIASDTWDVDIYDNDLVWIHTEHCPGDQDLAIEILDEENVYWPLRVGCGRLVVELEEAEFGFETTKGIQYIELLAPVLQGQEQYTVSPGATRSLLTYTENADGDDAVFEIAAGPGTVTAGGNYTAPENDEGLHEGAVRATVSARGRTTCVDAPDGDDCEDCLAAGTCPNATRLLDIFVSECDPATDPGCSPPAECRKDCTAGDYDDPSVQCACPEGCTFKGSNYCGSNFYPDPIAICNCNNMCEMPSCCPPEHEGYTCE